MIQAVTVDPDAIVNTSVNTWSLVAAVVTVIVAWILSRLTRKTVNTLGEKADWMRPEYTRLAARSSAYLVLFLGVGVALSFLGAQLQPLLAAVILIAVILSLAMRGIAENFAAGVILQSRRPIRIGDEIDSLGFNGKVSDINGRTVVVETFDGRVVHLPNAAVLSNPLVNDTAKGARRSEIEVRTQSGSVADTVSHLYRVVPVSVRCWTGRDLR